MENLFLVVILCLVLSGRAIQVLQKQVICNPATDTVQFVVFMHAGTTVSEAENELFMQGITLNDDPPVEKSTRCTYSYLNFEYNPANIAKKSKTRLLKS